MSHVVVAWLVFFFFLIAKLFFKVAMLPDSPANSSDCISSSSLACDVVIVFYFGYSDSYVIS